MNPSDTITPRHLLICGSVNSQSGSIANAHYLLLKEYLERGNFLTLMMSESQYEERDRKIPFHTHERVQFLRYEALSTAETLYFMMPTWARLARDRIYHDFFNKRNMKKLALSYTAEPSLDAICYLGYPAFFKLPDIPTISFPQSLPEIEWNALYSSTRTFTWKSRWGILQLWRLYYWYRMYLDDKSFQVSDHIIVLCDWLKDTIEKRYPEIPVSVLRFPFDLSRFSPPDVQSKQSPPQIVWLGRIVPRKRVDLFLEALAILRQDNIPFEAILIGNAGYFPEVQDRIDTAVAQGLITYHRIIPYKEVPSFLHQATVLVQPSEFETLGSSVIEAVAAHLKVVVGPTNGTLPKDSPNTFKFKEYTAESVASALRNSLEQSASTSETEISTFLNTYFSSDAAASTFSDIIEQTLSSYHP